MPGFPGLNMVDTAGGIEGQGGAAEDQCGQQVQGIAGAFDKIEQYRQGQTDEGQQNPQKMGIAAHGLPASEMNGTRALTVLLSEYLWIL